MMSRLRKDLSVKDSDVIFDFVTQSISLTEGGKVFKLCVFENKGRNSYGIYIPFEI